MEVRNGASSSSAAAVADAGKAAEGERLLGVAEKLLRNRDLGGCKDFALLAQEMEPLLEGSDRILAVVEVLFAADSRINNHHDWYAILQIDRRSRDHLDLIKKQYRRLALLLHPDKNHFPFADTAFKLVSDAWSVLSNSAKKSLYDDELSIFSRFDLPTLEKQRPPPPGETPSRRSAGGSKKKAVYEEAAATTTVEGEEDGGEEIEEHASRFWTACPYCYRLYEYPRVYEGCCLRCQNCRRAFHGALIPSLPPLVPGKEAYYCGWGFFPLGFVSPNSEGKISDKGFPNWMPPFLNPQPNDAPAAAVQQ